LGKDAVRPRADQELFAVQEVFEAFSMEHAFEKQDAIDLDLLG
jgi:hypothetical protein